jgi:hypothetical protein
LGTFSRGDRACLPARATSRAESSPLGSSKRARLGPAPATRDDPRHTRGATHACHDNVPGRGSLRRRRQRLRQPDQRSTRRVARPAKRRPGGARVTQGRVLGNHRAGSSPNQPPRPLQPVRKPIPRRRQAMDAVHVQTQMLAAPTAVMTQQTLIGLLEHPEQPMTIDIANPGCRHNALTTPCKPLLSKPTIHPSPCRRNHHSPTKLTTAPMTSTP